MGDSILSQAEIDALLNGDSEVKDEPTASVSGESDIRPYDPNTQRRVVRERLQALEIINERFARHFRMGLFNLLRRSPDITVGAIRIQPYHDSADPAPPASPDAADSAPDLLYVYAPPAYAALSLPLQSRETRRQSSTVA